MKLSSTHWLSGLSGWMQRLAFTYLMIPLYLNGCTARYGLKRSVPGLTHGGTRPKQATLVRFLTYTFPRCNSSFRN
ncbi:hypothetical protein D3C84_823720 [compost metagenome]